MAGDAFDSSNNFYQFGNNANSTTEDYNWTSNSTTGSNSTVKGSPTFNASTGSYKNNTGFDSTATKTSANAQQSSNNNQLEINQEVNQESDQEATATTNFGNVENSGNNNEVNDFGQLIINNQQYGGNNKSVNISYQGGADTQYKSTPVSDLTMGGYYDVEDSPADTANFVNKYSDLNTTNQQSYKNDALTSVAKYMSLARDNKATDTAELDKRVQAQPQYHLDMSIVEGAHAFGDQYGKTPAEWTSIKPEDEDIGIDDDIKNEIF